MERRLILYLEIKTVSDHARLLHAVGHVDYSILEVRVQNETAGTVEYVCGGVGGGWGRGSVLFHLYCKDIKDRADNQS